jgi:hypothetical protein
LGHICAPFFFINIHDQAGIFPKFSGTMIVIGVIMEEDLREEEEEEAVVD